jgi:hypothetical protein
VRPSAVTVRKGRLICTPGPAGLLLRLARCESGFKESDPLTPEARELWNEVAEVLAKELTAQVAIGRTATQEGIGATARILLNELWGSSIVGRAAASRGLATPSATWRLSIKPYSFDAPRREPG